jgi:penicillin-binding protein 2
MKFHKTIKDNYTEKRLVNARLFILVFFVTCIIIILASRLIYLQLYEYKRYSTLSKKNQMSIIPIPPPRGIIVDRNGEILAENRSVYAIEVIPERVNNLKISFAQLKQIIPSLTDDDVENFYRAQKHNRAFDPVPLKLKLTEQEVASFAVNQYRFPGFSIKARLMRHYPFKQSMAHIVGYVGRINTKELNDVNKSNYLATNFIGKVGIEKFYENLLHGKVGYEQVETDASGRSVRTLEKKPPESGKKLYLTIDAQLQTAAYNALGSNRGSVVLLSPQNGEVLAMVSKPSYDPNLFVRGISHKQYQMISNQKENPLYNRAIRGLYPPASTIKPFIGLGGLDQSIINQTFKIFDPGWYKLSNVAHIYRDWKRYGHGRINFDRAITVSCDTYFYHLAYLMGIRRIEDILSQFGFGHMTNIDLGEELGGLLPNKAWKITHKNTPWYIGDTLITGIGQGFMLATPLQLATATAAMATHGRRYRPHLLQHSVSSESKTIQLKKIQEDYPIVLKNNQNWEIVTNAMKNVIKSKEGTGFRFGRNSSYTIAAKTGTAQVVSARQYEFTKYNDIPELLRDHSLFIGFAPVEKPKVAIAVLVENDYIASNIARKVMDAYFTKYGIK